MKMSSNLVSSYPDDVEESIGDKFVHFSELLETDIATHIDPEHVSLEIQFYRLIMDEDNSLEATFINVEIALRIYLPRMVTNCNGDRSFSKLRGIKNELRNTMSQVKSSYVNDY